ncbi:amidase family protein [Qipengyuania sp. CAU 1752]
MTYPSLTSEPGGIAVAEHIRDGQLSPLEAVDEAIARIEKLDPAINAVVVRDFDRARDTAKALDGKDILPHQPLFGVPMTIKESFAIAGLPSCWGFKEYEGQLQDEDATVVRQLKAAGAILLGKTNIPPSLADWQSANPVYGRTGNPHDTTRSPGGSSGGSAAAVASGMVPLEYGTDIGGSVRVPAHFCGVWGHKTSWGLVSKQGHDHPAFKGTDAHDGALSIAGPLTRNADDLALMLELTATLPLRRRGKSIDKCRFLLLLDHPSSEVDASVRGPIEAAVEVLRKQGIKIDSQANDLPDLEADHAGYMKMLNVAMARGAPAEDGTRATATDWFDLLDMQARSELAWARLFESYDFILAPPAPILAMEHVEGQYFQGNTTINGKQVPAADGLAWAGIATFPNLPATVLPVGATGALPCGVQVIGPRWSDFDCIAAAKAIGAQLHD